ncbi:MAG: hypothetical protein U5R06_13935 [candidate division KSB1 bacterium]|nr:hypothetical protein [candidate division KSB1 bacterium]
MTLIDSLKNRNIEYSDSLYNELQSLISNQNQTIQLLISSLPTTGKDFMRFDSLQICWGGGFANDKGVIIEFPVVFIEPPKVFITQALRQDLSGVTHVTESSAKFYTYGGRNFINFCAIGKWQ